MDVRYKDYRDGSRRKVMTLTGEELIRRFLLHVLTQRVHARAPFRLPGQPLPGALPGADPHGPRGPAAGAGTRHGTGGDGAL